MTLIESLLKLLIIVGAVLGTVAFILKVTAKHRESFTYKPENKQSDNNGLNRAVIVEPREHIALKIVLKNIAKKMNIPITIVHGMKNKEFVKKIADKIPQVDIMTEINAENLNAATYSKLLTSLEFWENIGANENDHILIFQTDSGICGKGCDIHKFSKYDYCGAPWLNVPHPTRNLGNVGNGGFSIRSVAHAKKHIKQYGSSTTNEDVVFSKWCYEDNECNVCPSIAAHQFCTETVAEKSTAFHNNWAFHNISSCKLNDKIKMLNKTQPAAKFPVPDEYWWNPQCIMRYIKNDD